MSNYASKALVAASVLLIGVPTASLSHTNSIGYVGGGSGAVTFWYGNWHPGTTFNEGTLTLQGINGTNFSPSTVNWTLIQQTMPDGLIPGTNYFTSDGTQLVPYDPNVQTSYSWQGVTFTGLSAGDYQFTYNAAGAPTVNWMPMDSVILSSTVSLSAAALSGDANQNGILDIYETGGTPPPPAAPTQVSSASGNNIVTTSTTSGTRTTSGTPHRHIMGTNADGNETETHYTDTAVTTIPTTTVTTTTTPVTVTTWSDGTTTTTNGTPVVTSVTTDDNAGTTVITQATVTDWVKTRTYDVQRSDYTPSGAAPTITETHRFNATENSEKQKVNRHVTTAVTTPTVRDVTTTAVYTKVYTDGTPTVVTTDTPVVTYETSTSYAEYHAYRDYFGRIDQLEVLDKVSDGVNGLLNHEPSRTKQKFRVFDNNRFVQSYNGDGYKADSKIFGGGFELDLSKGWTVGAQYNQVNTNLDGVDSKSRQKKDHIGIFSALHGNTVSLNTNAAVALNKYNYDRTVEDVFNNSGETQGQEWWVTNRLYVHAAKWLKPFLGYTVKNVQRDGYTESGSIQSARTVESVNQTTHVGEVGLKIEKRLGKFGVSADGAYGTDNSYGVTAAIDYNEFLFVEGSHGVSDGVTTNSVAGKVKFRF
jgi:hypothetical protein